MPEPVKLPSKSGWNGTALPLLSGLRHALFSFAYLATILYASVVMTISCPLRSSFQRPSSVGLSGRQSGCWARELIVAAARHAITMPRLLVEERIAGFLRYVNNTIGDAGARSFGLWGQRKGLSS